MQFTQVRAASRRKKSRVNVILTPLADSQSGEAGHKLSILVKKGESYRDWTPADYFKDKYLTPVILSPFSFLPSRFLSQNYEVKAYPRGGGLSSQAKAMTIAIARALVQYYPEMRSSLRKANLLTQDSRIKERKKIGKYKARRSPQFTKR
ncbi:30S ribosomal protein S9 [Candidatus Mycoplasma haematominutum]|uniref:30S ribosomal protein S9 n=1 Tax=Candidatus Mycoplasma haematominutum 'Birmingham 1' TaxID=1116213 RepID=G8C309_9MOLU|nr:30S ribosomal protein S9 [Candidatus Mycoplasma haematominutum]CCE66707.1 ribosomal protein S9 [Candidatus Mycoplasma haematominutum 'Birmingham 1']